MGGLKVLLVDDEEEFAATLEERLRLRGIEAEYVSDGGRAIERVREKNFDVIVIDVMMPGIGGIEVLKNVKAIEPRARVILLTGRGEAGDSEEGLRLGAFDYLIKPINIDRLIEIMMKAAGRAE